MERVRNHPQALSREVPCGWWTPETEEGVEDVKASRLRERDPQTKKRHKVRTGREEAQPHAPGLCQDHAERHAAQTPGLEPAGLASEPSSSIH